MTVYASICRDSRVSGFQMIYLSYEMPFYTGYIPGIYEIVRSARLQNFDRNAAAHRYWIARVFNVLQNVAAVPLGIRQPA